MSNTLPNPSELNVFFSVTAVAKAAGVTRQTIYNWLEAGLIERRYVVDGAPIFGAGESRQIVELARARRRARTNLRLDRAEPPRKPALPARPIFGTARRGHP